MCCAMLVVSSSTARAKEIIAEAIENSVDEDIACQRTRRLDCRVSKAASGIKVDEAVAAIGDEDDDDHNEAAP